MANKTVNIVNTINAYGKSLFDFIRYKVNTEADAEDIMQDVWYQLSNINDTNEIEQLRGWLFRVARNKIIDKNRKKTEELIDDICFGSNNNPDNGDELDFRDILLTDDEDPEAVYIKELFWEELLTALDELPENQRNVFVWNEMENKTLQQIADETGEKLKTIISRKGYAVKHLRTRLERLYDEFLEY
ncbi:MAG TPA: sigma-70 family RNA polymerase sigma factor [Mucilaginibacter sp.]